MRANTVLHLTCIPFSFFFQFRNDQWEWREGNKVYTVLLIMETIRYMVDCNLVCAAAHTKGDLRRKKKIKLRKLGHV
jgi:hypothetical protein